MSSSAQQLKGKSLTSFDVRSKVALKTLAENETLGGAIIVFLGALFLLGTFPFYPAYLVPILALACGLIAYFGPPPVGVLLSGLLAFPAVAYQSILFGWLFLLVVAIIAFESFDWFQDNKNDKWAMVAVLEILILAPFAFGSSPFFGWISILGMTLASLYFGSKKSLSISIPSVFLILLLSTIWLVQNNAFMPIKIETYEPGMNELFIQKEAIEDITAVPSAIGSSLGGLLDFQQMQMFYSVVALVIQNMMLLIFSDSGLLQIATWLAVLYGISSLSGGKGKTAKMAPLLLLLVLPAYYLICSLFGYYFNLGLIVAVVATIGMTEGLMLLGVKTSREVEERHREKMKAFGKFGVQDISTKGGIKLEDIGNYDDVKQELRDSIMIPLEKKDIAAAYGMKPPSGILLFGPPGTGKTMLMRALAANMGYYFIEVKSSEILSMWVGESEKNVAEIFANARKLAPAIIYFDEIDSLGKKRSAASGDDVAPRVLSMMLQEMDGAVKSKKPVLVVGTTNVPDQIDPALLRPGRFDKIIYMHLPDKEGRKKVFQVHLSKVPTDENIDFDKLATKTERFSGADIKNVVDEAVRIAAKEATLKGIIIPVTMDALLEILKKVRPSTGIAQLENYDRFKMDFQRSISGEDKKEEKQELTSWKDVVGLDKVKETLLETIELPLLKEELMKEYKIKPSKGILLFGPPGTGKTLIVKAASTELKAAFQTLSGAEVMKQGYSQAVTVVKEAFNRARENTPAIIFIDEIETFAPARGSASVSSEIVGQLLTEMDGLKELKGVVVVAATNKPAILDSAILRPGRFDKIFYIPPPDKRGREEMFKLNLGKFGDELDLSKPADMTEGFSGADIAAICQEAKMRAVRGKLKQKEVKIDVQMLIEIISGRRPSITSNMLVEYDRFKKEYGERS